MGVGIGPAPGPAAPAVGSPPAGWALSSIGASGLTAASIALLLLYLTGRFLWMYSKSASASASSSAAASSSLPISRPRAATVPPPPPAAALLPVLLRAASPSAECAVSLAELGDGARGMVLPRCGHGGFHEECIATWLRVSTTCPLCRTPAAAK